MEKLTEKDWVEAFEEINGRKPTSDEFMEAKKNDEFQFSDNRRFSRIGTNGSFVRKIKSRSCYKIWIATILVGLGVLCLILVRGISSTSTFDQENFETGSWVVMGMKKEDGVDVVGYRFGAWDDFFPAFEEDDDFTYTPFEEFLEKQDLEDDDILDWPSAKQIVAKIEETTGLGNLRTQKLMVISKGSQHRVFYWLTRDRAAVYMPLEETVYIAQKSGTNLELSGSYTVTDYYTVGLVDFEDRLSDRIYDFDESIVRDTDMPEWWNNDFDILPLNQFLEVYQLAGGDLSDIKNLAEINQRVRKLDYRIDSLNTTEVILVDDGWGIAADSGLLLPVGNGEKIIMTPTMSVEWIKNLAEEIDDTDAVERLLKITKIVAVAEKN